MALPRRPFRFRAHGLAAVLGAVVVAATAISPVAPATAAATVSISGVLVDSAGSTAGYQWLEAYEYAGADTWGTHVASVRTEIGGEFSIGGLESGRQYRIRVNWSTDGLHTVPSFPGFFTDDPADPMTREPSLAALFTPGPEGITGLTLRLEPATTMTGRVVNQDGTPLAGIDVYVMVHSPLRDIVRYGSHQSVGKVVTASDGTFRAVGLEYLGDEIDGWFVRTGPPVRHHAFLGTTPANGLVPVDQARIFPPTSEPVTGVEIVIPEVRLPADQIVLGSISYTTNDLGAGEVLAVGSGTLSSFGFTEPGGQLTNSHAIRTGFEDERVYAPGDWGGAALDWIESGNPGWSGFRPYPDLVSVDARGDMYLYEGNGHGYLREPRKIGWGWSGYRVIPAGDLNQDAIPDLLAIDRSGYLKLYRGDGKGGFLYPYPRVGNGWNGFDLYSSGDLNRDGRNDILSVDARGDLWMYAGNGNGTFQMRKKVGNGWGAYTLAAGADIDGYHREGWGDVNSAADIVGRDDATGDLYLYSGRGDGTFATKRLIATGW